MHETLAVTIGQHAEAGARAPMQDCHGAVVPEGAALALKGVAAAVADGISSSAVSHLAAGAAVASFLTDYYATSDAWTVKTAGQRVIEAANAWLHARTRALHAEEGAERGHVTTFSAIVLKGRVAHLFHVGDSRIGRVSGDSVEVLTTDHRIVLSAVESYLGRALGIADTVEIDYRAVDLAVGDVFVLTTDGVHDHVPPRTVARLCAAAPEEAARALVAEALERGSDDNLTAQVLRVDALPPADASPLDDALPPVGPLPSVPGTFEGWRIVRQIHATSRSHIFLGLDAAGRAAALKFPSADLSGDARYLRRMMMEEWIARRVASPHVVAAAPSAGPRSVLCVATAYVEGETLRQIMTDDPAPDLARVRDIVGQIARGLRAFHRREMVHRDLRPENVIVDRDGTVKIIDLGAVRVAGVVEAAPEHDPDELQGEIQYAAPEYFLGEIGTPESDQFSLAVIAYEMLSGRLPYGAAVPRTRTARAQRRLVYTPAGTPSRPVPAFMDAALARALDPDPARRYEALSEFVEDLSRPGAAFTAATGRKALARRNPLLFWQLLSLALGAAVVALLLR